MSYSLLVRPEAQADLEQARKWYEEQATGLGRQFVKMVDDTLVSITKNPLAYPVIRKVVRRALTKRFPYGETLMALPSSSGWLDFGVSNRHLPAQFSRLSPELVCLSGKAGIGLELSLYAAQGKTDAEA